MVAFDEDALICDLAETYMIYDYRSLPAELVATFAVGLRENSRIKTKMNGMKMPLDEYLMAAIFDAVNWLCYTHTKNSNPPQRILDILLERAQNDSKKDDDFVIFDSAEEFENARRALMEG